MGGAIIIVIEGVQRPEREVQSRSCRSVDEKAFLGNSGFVLDLEEWVG